MGIGSAGHDGGMNIIRSLPNNTARNWWADKGMRQLALAIGVGFAGVVNSGYDGSLMNGLLSMPLFVTSIGNPDGNKLGIISAAYSLGTIIGVVFASYLADRLGRKLTISLGASIIIVGAVFQTFSTGGNQFLGSRLVIGFGAAFQGVASPAYVSEIAHPRNRPQAVALINTCWYIGSIIAAWACFGTLQISNHWCWKIPCLLQVVPCVWQLAAIYFVPESPRWLISKGRCEEARAVLCKYHANGAEDDALVAFEFKEMQEAIANEQAAKEGTSYKAFLKTPGNRHRLLIIVLVGLFSQWVGNGIISYYLARILQSVGITSANQQAGLNGGLQIWNWFWAIAGSMSCERLGRRFLWLSSAIGMLVFYIAITVCSAMYAQNATSGAGYATIAFLFLYFAAYDIAFTGLTLSYPTEILPFSLRTKGLSILQFSIYGALFFNQYVNPIALEALAWKYYIVYDCILAVSIICIYFCYPETKGLTLEEVTVVFDGKTVGETESPPSEARDDTDLDQKMDKEAEISHHELAR